MHRVFTRRDGDMGSKDDFQTIDSGHSEGAPGYSTAGSFYFLFVIVYTLLVAIGAVYLILARRSTAMRLRGTCLTVASVLIIQVYTAAVFIVYPLNGHYTCSEEFWYMNVVFPLGIAIYQAANFRLLAVAKIQSESRFEGKWAKSSSDREKKQPHATPLRVLVTWFKQAGFEKKSYLFIALGISFQIIITFFLFYGSKRFRPDTGFFGTHVDEATCRTGFEWIPSVLWQFIWTWIIGPWVLFRSRNIQDTHYWALQTRISIVAGLPGTPLWLAFLYAKNDFVRTHIVPWWPPAFWFLPGLMAIQFSIFGCALADMRRNEKWSFRRATSSKRPHVTPVQWADATSPKDLSNSRRAFRAFLEEHLDALSQFAATRDFTGEHVEFIRQVRSFTARLSRYGKPTGAQICKMYQVAALIFFELVEPSTAIMPINIDYTTLKSLKEIFANAAYEPGSGTKRLSVRRSGQNAQVVPWKEPEEKSSIDTSAVERLQSALAALHTASSVPNLDAKEMPLGAELGISETASGHGDVRPRNSEDWVVPPQFDSCVFREAEGAIMYLVYTNTWRNFLRCGDQELLSNFAAKLGEDADANSELEERVSR